MHFPPRQASPWLQTVLQAPQLKRSVAVSTHERPHCLSPAVQVVTQRAAWQSSPVAHLAPHLPQLLGSLSRLLQAPVVQRSSGLLQAQALPLHDSSVEQAVAQVPQWVRSRVRSMQLPPQLVSPPPQVVPQTPALQTLPASQVRPQPPQFEGSLLSSTHLSPQRTSVARQETGAPRSGVQRLATQTKLSGHGKSPGVPQSMTSVLEHPPRLRSAPRPSSRNARDFIGRERR
jgi:hypothetical protein